MKIADKLILRALRLYSVADDNSSIRDIKKLQTIDGEHFVRSSFVFDGRKYVLIYGAGVDEEYVEEFWPDQPNDARALKNPLDGSELVTPFHGKYIMLFEVSPSGQRLDHYLASDFDSSISRSLWQKYIKAGYVSINGQVAESSRHEVTEADEISVEIPKLDSKDHDVAIVYEDDDVVVVNKPIGMLSHAKGGINLEQTVEDIFRSKLTEGEDVSRGGVVHRLDRATSGLMIGARNESSAKFIQKQFSNRTVDKVYYAVVEGELKTPKAMIDLPIARHPNKPSTFRVDPSGKPAKTLYEVVDFQDGLSLVRLMPETGRTHQLRVHMSYLGNPILGDIVYGKPSDRMYLHASQLGLVLPSGDKKEFKSKLPKSFTDKFPGVKL